MFVLCSLLLFLWLSVPGSVINAANGQGLKTNVKVLETGGCDLQCPSVGEMEATRNEIHQIVASVIASSVCNGTPGWRRIAFINMTDTSYNCPTGLRLTSYSKRTCGGSHTTWERCSSTAFSVGNLPYSRVCGRIRGYQVGSTDAFFNTQEIDDQYVSGVSLTHGAAGRRQHIWTFAAGRSEVFSHGACPCDTVPPSVVPSFVGNDYFCESGLHSAWRSQYYGVFHSNDILWDGQGCTSNSTCCQFNNPPWFAKNLPSATTDDIELRICTPNSIPNADVPLELIELYVQ